MKSKVLTPKELEIINAKFAAAQIKDGKPVREYSSRFKGVYKEKTRVKCFKAAIKYGKKLYALGYYYTDEQAAYAYDQVASILFGEKAELNFQPDAISEELKTYFQNNPVKVPEIK
jgi:hypothetical protein